MRAPLLSSHRQPIIRADDRLVDATDGAGPLLAALAAALPSLAELRVTHGLLAPPENCADVLPALTALRLGGKCALLFRVCDHIARLAPGLRELTLARGDWLYSSSTFAFCRRLPRLRSLALADANPNHFAGWAQQVRAPGGVVQRRCSEHQTV